MNTMEEVMLPALPRTIARRSGHNNHYTKAGKLSYTLVMYTRLYIHMFVHISRKIKWTVGVGRVDSCLFGSRLSRVPNSHFLSPDRTVLWKGGGWESRNVTYVPCNQWVIIVRAFFQPHWVGAWQIVSSGCWADERELRDWGSSR